MSTVTATPSLLDKGAVPTLHHKSSSSDETDADHVQLRVARIAWERMVRYPCLPTLQNNVAGTMERYRALLHPQNIRETRGLLV
jgi:hypothetical protein